MSRDNPENSPPIEDESFFSDPEENKPVPPDTITAIPSHDLSPLEARLVKFESVFAWGLHALLVALGLALAGLMFAQVLMRYVFEASFVGIEEAAVLLGVWTYFVGMAFVTRQGEHIHGGIIGLIVHDRNTLRLIRICNSIVCFVAAAIFGYFAIRYALFEIEKGRLSSYLRWPKGLWSASMIVGFAGMVAYFFMQTVNQIVDYRKHKKV